MGDLLKVIVFFASVIGLGVGAYVGVTVVQAAKKGFLHWERRSGVRPEQLDSIQARLAETEALAARVAELEERMDFTERLLAERRETERLPGGAGLDNQH